MVPDNSESFYMPTLTLTQLETTCTTEARSSDRSIGRHQGPTGNPLETGRLEVQLVPMQRSLRARQLLREFL